MPKNWQIENIDTKKIISKVAMMIIDSFTALLSVSHCICMRKKWKFLLIEFTSKNIKKTTTVSSDNDKTSSNSPIYPEKLPSLIQYSWISSEIAEICHRI